MSIIDSHIHLWDLKNNINSWVTKSGDLRLQQSFTLNDYLIQNPEVVSIVTVEAADGKHSLSEVAWLEHSITPNLGAVKLKHIAYINLLLDNELFINELDKFRQFPWVVGVRDISAYSKESKYCPCSEDITLDKQKLQRLHQNLTTLKENNYIFNCQMYPDQLLRIYDIVIDATVKCAIDHCALPNLNASFKNKEWLLTLKQYGTSAMIKLSGFNINDNEAYIERILLMIKEHVPVENLMFASNFPVTTSTISQQTKGFLNQLYNKVERYKILYQNAYGFFKF